MFLLCRETERIKSKVIRMKEMLLDPVLPWPRTDMQQCYSGFGPHPGPNPIPDVQHDFDYV